MNSLYFNNETSFLFVASLIIYLNSLQNLCVTAAHCPIREILEKEKKVSLL